MSSQRSNSLMKCTSQQYLNVQMYNNNSINNGTLSKDVKLKVNEYTYFIDNEGYLIDNNCYYILDCNNNKIKIKENEINKLQQYGLLKNQ